MAAPAPPPAAAPPLTLDAAADLVRKSRLVPEDRLVEALQESGDGTALLHRLTAAGLLTAFQARHIGRGKWKGFLLGTHYRLLEPLGKGGMGTVFLAEHSAMRRKVAVKVLAAELAADSIALARFTREARAAARLVHPNVVHTIDVDPDSQPPFLVLEYVDGVTLQAAVARTGTFNPETAAFCAVQALTGLQKAHELGLVHRDIKPANLMVDRKGTVKLLDLGIVRLANNTGNGLTMAGGAGKVILGTADYLSPEQALNSSNVDTRADVYSVGCTLFFLLAGHPPFNTGSAARKLVAKQMQDAPNVQALRPDVSDGLAAVLAKLLARKPEDRYPTPAAAAAALVPFATPEHGFPGRLFGMQAPDVLSTPPPMGHLTEPTPTDSPRTNPALGTNSSLHYVLPEALAASLAAPADPPPAEAPRTPPPARPKAGAGVMIGLAVLAVLAAAVVWVVTQ